MKFRTVLLYLLLPILLAACGVAVEAVETPAVAPTAAPTAAREIEAEDARPTEDTAVQGQGNIDPQFVILPEASEARFYIDEVLRGEPKTVEGITQQVTGSVVIEELDPLVVDVQPIEVQAGAFITDSNFRNRAISDAILQAGRFPTIVFNPTSIDGLPSRAGVGEAYAFEVTGDLTIRDITQPVTFQVALNADSTDSFSGLARTTIDRTVFGLNIPSVPQVANVSEQVILEFEFSALRAR